MMGPQSNSGSSRNPFCGRTAAIVYQGKTIHGTLTDKCPGCVSLCLSELFGWYWVLTKIFRAFNPSTSLNIYMINCSLKVKASTTMSSGILLVRCCIIVGRLRWSDRLPKHLQARWLMSMVEAFTFRGWKFF